MSERASTPLATVFSPATVAWLVLIGGGAFCAMLVSSVMDDPAAGNVTTASTFSRSAVGYHAFAELLRANGYRVRTNRDMSLAGVGNEDLLVILAPDTDNHNLKRLNGFVLQSLAHRPVLVGLPKWDTQPARTKRGWIDRASRVPSEQLDKVLGTLPLDNANVVEDKKEAGTWHSDIGTVEPRLDEPQLIAAEMDWEPLVWTAEGTLLGRVRNIHIDTDIVVLSDTDILANHGLHRGENAELALAWIDRFLPAGGSVVFDETLHGFAIVHSVWRMLFQPPYIAATALALAAAAFTIWQAAVRFGAPVPAQSGPVFRRGTQP